MTEISRFWEGIISEGAPGDAGVYSSAQFATFLSRILDGAEQANRGVLRGVENELAVTPNSPTAKNVLVDTGAAVVQGRWYYNDSQATVTIAANVSGSTRIDLIVLEADYIAQTVRLAVEQGTPGAGQPDPQQIANTLWQVPIAYVTLASGYSTVTTTMITDLREYANIPANVGSDVASGSSNIFENGSVVIWTGSQITHTTSAEVRTVAGVVERRILGDGTGRIITHGIFPVLCNAPVVSGDYLVTSTTIGQAGVRGTQSPTLPFARVLASNTGAGTRCLAYIDVPVWQGESIYDSGWFAVTISTTYTKAHGLGITPRFVEVYHSTTATPGAGDELVRVTSVDDATNGISDLAGADATNIYLTTGSNSAGVVNSRRRFSNTGFYRIVARR